MTGISGSRSLIVRPFTGTFDNLTFGLLRYSTVPYDGDGDVEYDVAKAFPVKLHPHVLVVILKGEMFFEIIC